jgi:hypothetical protein
LRTSRSELVVLARDRERSDLSVAIVRAMPGDSPSRRLRRPRAPIHDRAYLLRAEKRNDVLALSEVQRYGSDSLGDPDYITIYGLRPAEWYARGVRPLARTVVECTRDALADRMGRDVAAVARAAPGVSGTVVVDPFAGSANTLYWLARHCEPTAPSALSSTRASTRRLAAT